MSKEFTVENTAPKRDTVAFWRIQAANKKWVADEAKKAGFPDAATYADALLTKLRTKKK